MIEETTLAVALVSAFKARGMKRLFGVPGGGSSLDLINAANQLGVEFVLCRGETSAALMAAVSSELTGVPHVALTGIAPGAASAVNGAAYASLERAPMVLITDAKEPVDGTNSHQIFDQGAMFAPLTKASLMLSDTTRMEEVEHLLDLALTAPQGPLHLDLSAKVAKSPLVIGRAAMPTPANVGVSAEKIQGISRLISASQKPVLLVGLEARDKRSSDAVTAIAETLGSPVLTTYKAKGVFDETHPLFVGAFTGAQAEGETLHQSDLIIGFGLDPVEIIPGKWPYSAGFVTINTAPDHLMPTDPSARIHGNLSQIGEMIGDQLSAHVSAWDEKTIARLRHAMVARLALPSSDGLTTDVVVRAARDAAPDPCRATIDAGAHMFSAMTQWTARHPHDVLKSNGLSTMGFALPAAIASALENPERPVIAFTGDGGLMMCLAELSTAVRLGCNITVIVLNDGALSLIDIKQQRHQHPSVGVRYPRVDFRSCAEGMGCPAWQVTTLEQVQQAVKVALDTPGPALIDVHVDPSGYAAQLDALRG